LALLLPGNASDSSHQSLRTVPKHFSMNIEEEGPPQLIEVDEDEAPPLIETKLGDLNLVKVPITIVTGTMLSMIVSSSTFEKSLQYFTQLAKANSAQDI